MFQYVWISLAVINVIIFIAGIVIYSMTLEWINKLEVTQCKCSEDYKRDFIKYFLYFYLAFVVLNFINIIVVASYTFYKVYKGKTPNKYVTSMGNIIQPIWKVISKLILPVLFLINIVFSIMYIIQLKTLHSKLECLCSKDIRADIYYYWNIFIASFGCLLLLASGIIILVAQYAK